MRTRPPPTASSTPAPTGMPTSICSPAPATRRSAATPRNEGVEEISSPDALDGLSPPRTSSSDGLRIGLSRRSGREKYAYARHGLRPALAKACPPQASSAADPRPFSDPLRRRLSAASWTACPPPALFSHVGCFGSYVDPKRAPCAELHAASAGCIGFGQSCRMYARVSSCSRALSMSCDERACPRCVPVHGRRTFASMYVKQSGSTLFQYHIFD
mmetsp:Transcript_32132/g.79543  ORF Transcript_32132/g.79543 Transcript_32132/m.79543 type:complete len:215 (-) Transcript_32132:3-647(-)